MEIDNTN